MSHWIVDASVVIHLLLKDEQFEAARTFFDRALFDPPDEFHAPDILPSECGNVLWKRVRFSGLPLEDARERINLLLDLRIQYADTRDMLDEALTLGAKHEIAVYDGLYMALAARLDCPLVTADMKLLQKARDAGLSALALDEFIPEGPAETE